MASQTLAPPLTLNALKTVRRTLREALALPLVEDQPTSTEAREQALQRAPSTLAELGDLFRAASLDDAAEEGPNVEGRWFLSSVDPAGALLLLPGLRVKPGFRLATYLLRTPSGGIGHTCALPEDRSLTTQLESPLTDGSEWHYPPYPEGCLQQVMQALTGDRSPLSFVVASLWGREIEELGATGRDRQWSHHQLIETVPARIEWRWRDGEIPSDRLIPRLQIDPNGSVTVEFYTCRILKPYALFRHRDSYPADSYLSRPDNQAIAVMAD